MASISPNEKVLFNVEHPVRTEIDKTTDANYTFISRSLDPRRPVTQKGWQCYRITNANGTLKFPLAPSGLIDTNGAPVLVGSACDDFVFVAADAATYTYA